MTGRISTRARIALFRYTPKRQAVKRKPLKSRGRVAVGSARAFPVTVVMGDPSLPDAVKKNSQFNKEDFETIKKLQHALEKIEGYRFNYVNNHLQLMDQLQRSRPSLVFNLCDEGFRNQARKELHVPALFEMFDVPYTGAGPACLGLCYHKANVRAIAADLDVPVPREEYLQPEEDPILETLRLPVLVKPNYGDNSVGITRRSVAATEKEFAACIQELRKQMPGIPLLVQEFLPDTEYSVGLIGNPGEFRVLPILEVDFSRLPERFPKILSYESKWDPASPYWTDIRYKRAKLSEKDEEQLAQYAMKLFERLECRDYARFDFRADNHGTIKLLEVNPNPGWCWDGKLSLMAELDGMDYAEMLKSILDAAKKRLNA